MEKNHPDKLIQLHGELFEEVQRKRIFPDSKQFVDMVPVTDPDEITRLWSSKKKTPGFDLNHFISEHFILPEGAGEEVQIEKKEHCRDHIKALWPQLFRKADKSASKNSSLIPLPKPYVVPGGRFREIYYWDSYFTAQGLHADGFDEMVLAMAENFRHLIETTGHVPNGNRAYYLSRSQPPFFTPMVNLVVTIFGNEKISEFLPAVEREYNFWMDNTGSRNRRAVTNYHQETSNSIFLNRYWDDYPAPREESWFEDMETASGIPESEREAFFRNIRAACESGWDFSSRWFSDGQNLSSIETTSILPVDLNTLLWFMERKLSEWSRISGDESKAAHYASMADKRSAAINSLMWDEEQSFFFDYHFKNKSRTGARSLAAVYPLYFKMANQEQAEGVARNLEEKFLQDGGLLTTTVNTGQQWDSPNGWAPLQWLAVIGLQNYGLNDLADEIRNRWLRMNEEVYQRSGKLVEKYNVSDISQEGGGGEYPLQDGFGWSNGVFSAFDEGKE
ncbi:MAG: alpha,alpha-trehalase TreF [Balneolaceae bacterium]|nr:MAG: alpha,alpha-trehalase TreF [Balneolaceae bacterium]